MKKWPFPLKNLTCWIMNLGILYTCKAEGVLKFSWHKVPVGIVFPWLAGKRWSLSLVTESVRHPNWMLSNKNPQGADHDCTLANRLCLNINPSFACSCSLYVNKMSLIYHFNTMKLQKIYTSTVKNILPPYYCLKNQFPIGPLCCFISLIRADN